MLCWKDEAVGGEEMCRWLMALRLLFCLEKHASGDFLDRGCDHWEIRLPHFSISFFSCTVFVSFNF